MNGNLLVENIRTLCKKHNISIGKLESDLFLSPGLISRWNKNIPSMDKIMDIAQYFGVSIDDVVGYSAKTSDQFNTDQLLLILYNRSLVAKINWDILDFQSPPEYLKNITPASFYKVETCDCYYASYMNGFFFFVVTRSLLGDVHFALFVLPDVHAKPECICSDANRLTQLYEYLERRFSKNLNKMKAANYVNAFIADSTDTFDDGADDEKITLLKSVSGDNRY